ncbi:hypothetical protein INT45_006048 [Circinella minor]|uniref:Transcription activator GCR1-like domain-containing protein n=1 Tax=Circinella minor TaxID=1195481 RepID=A0A8H7RYX6_9FUNG|nr:hypothetical protein INT45_006048 [Circinella minor]
MSPNGNWFKMKVIHGARPRTKKDKGKQPARTNDTPNAVSNDDNVPVADIIDGDESSDDEAPKSDNIWECAISKETHTRFIKAAFKASDIFVARKATHIPRASAAKMADLAGVPDSQIRRQGLWNSDTMTNSYVNSLPREFSDLQYHLPRAKEPCDELKNLVFPWADYWYDHAAVMMDHIPDHPIWKHELFKNPLFTEFRRKVKAHVETNEDPGSSIIERFAPEVQDQLTNMNRILVDTLKEVRESQINNNQSQQQSQQQIQQFQQFQQTINNIISGRQQLQLSVRLDNGNLATGTTASSSNNSDNNNNNSSSSSLVSINSEQLQQPESSIPPTDTTPNSPATSTANATISLQYTDAGIPVYKMSRQVLTVNDLWAEWTLGRDGFWPVQELDNKWGTKWRRGDKKWFNIRKKVIDAVNDLQENLGLTPTTAIQNLQNVMNARGWSLDRLGTELQSKNFFPSEQTKRRKLARS